MDFAQRRTCNNHQIPNSNTSSVSVGQWSVFARAPNEMGQTN